MSFKLEVLLVTCAIFSNLIYFGLSKSFQINHESLGFPEEEPVKAQRNKDNRIPIYAPGRCPINQLLYPGDQSDDWICDCAGGYIYYPPDDTCYRSYSQGPCPLGQYLVLKADKVVPECVTNPCIDKNVVPFKGKCEKLGDNKGACPPLKKSDAIELGINATTLEVACVPPAYDLNTLSIFVVPNKSCPRGSKRTATGQCRKEE